MNGSSHNRASSQWNESEHSVPLLGEEMRQTYVPDEGEFASRSSFASFDFEGREMTLPLKDLDDEELEDDIPIPRPTFTSNNSLRNLTRQLAKEGKEGKLPLSPVSKKKSLNGLSSPYASPGTLRGRVSLQAHSQSPGPMGGSLHSRSRRRLSPAPLSGGSLHGRSRTTKSSRDNLGGSLHGKRSSSPCPKGSLRGTSSTSSSRETSPSPGPAVGVGARRGSFHSRSKSPGALSGSTHQMRNVSPGPLGTRSKSPGTLHPGRRSMRSQRRLSLKRGGGPVSILRSGRFSQANQQKELETSGRSISRRFSPSTSEHGSPPGGGGFLSQSRRPPRMKRVHFWFHDEPSVAPSYGTEDSIQFGDLGFDDSGDLSEQEVGGRSMRGEMSFIEVMGLEGEEGLNDEDDDCDYLATRFNGSTIHEEFGASLGGGFNSSLRSLLTEDSGEDGLSAIEEKGSQPRHHSQSDSSFALPEFHDSSDSYKESFRKDLVVGGSMQNSDIQSSILSRTEKSSSPSYFAKTREDDYSSVQLPNLDTSSPCSISPRDTTSRRDSRPKLLTKQLIRGQPYATAAAARPGIGFLASLLNEESEGTNDMGKDSSRISPRHNSDSSLDDSFLKQEAGSSSLKSKSDSTSETSSESPTSVSILN